MTITCSCGARLKIGDDKLTDTGVRIKCPKCGTVHLAKRPQRSPATPAPSEPAMPWFAAASPGAAHGTLVLVAHDSKVVADMIDGVLKEGGFVTEYAPNGLEALRKASELKPVVMIVDVGLTGIYGFELCERLKGDPGTRNIKIVLLSSVYGLTAYKRPPSNLYGADDYIEKHHIPDQLLAKVQGLLSGAPAPAVAASPRFEPPAAETDKGSLPPPLVSRKGVVQTAAEPPVRGLEQRRAASPLSAPNEPPKHPAIPEEPSILPKVPVTLDTSRTRAEAPPVPPASAPLPPTTADRPKAPPAPPAQAPAPRTVPVSAEPVRAAVPKPEPTDASVKLDVGFFEQDEYEAPAKPASAAADPEEIEKARRFARIIVSDIALYNQEAVVEGIKKGTFYELLKDDITEGRVVYDNRVPEAIRRTKDYLQEAFDDFLAAKKKLR